MLKTLRDSLSAGILISIGGCVFLACDNKYVGAVMFTVALLCICLKGYYLFTGKIGYLVDDHSPKNILRLFVGLAGNLAATFLIGMLIRTVMPALGETATAICMNKLGTSFFPVLVRGIFCGVLMYLAVSIYAEKKTVVGIIFCIPVFIISGFEHSIADCFYLGASGIFTPAVAGFIATVVLGNTIGAVILPLLSYEKRKKNDGQ